MSMALGWSFGRKGRWGSPLVRVGRDARRYQPRAYPAFARGTPAERQPTRRGLDLNYDTIRHHLDVLADNDVVKSSGNDYGAVYLPTDRARHHWDTVEDIITQLD